MNFRDENAQIKTSVNSKRAHVILKKGHFIIWEIFLGQRAPSRGSEFQMPLQKGKGANCKYLTLTIWTFRQEKGIHQK